MHDYKYYLVCFLDWLGSFLTGILSKEAMSALIGASIAGWFSFKATKKAHTYALDKAEREEAKITRQTLSLMLVEIQTAWKIYKEEYAPDLERLPDEVPYLVVFPLGENIFVVYDSAPSCIANLPEEISSTLVRIYMRLKGMVAMINLNNEETLQAVKLGRELMMTMEHPVQDVDGQQDRLTMHQARRMKMETNAQSMRALALEIEELYVQLVTLSKAIGVTIK